MRKEEGNKSIKDNTPLLSFHSSKLVVVKGSAVAVSAPLLAAAVEDAAIQAPRSPSICKYLSAEEDAHFGKPIKSDK